MARALIQTVNASTQALEAGSIIPPGTTIHRYGCGLNLSGNGVEIYGDGGYYSLDATVTVSPTAAGPVTVQLQRNGVPIPGAVGSTYQTTAEQPVTVPIIGTLRLRCCDGAASITAVLTEGAGNLENYSLRIARQ